MILQTMNDDEKTFEAFRIYPIAYDIYKEYYHQIVGKFRRGNRFPYRNRVLFDDDRGNKWHLVFECPSKVFAKKGLVRTYVYSIYTVTKKKPDGNCGKGILVYDPVEMYKYANKQKHKLAVVVDIVPHVFNQYSKRLLQDKGLKNIEFERKVETLLESYEYFDVMGDKSSGKHADKGLAPYDIFMKDGGIIRGYFVNETLIRFFTYVSKDILFDDQKKWYDEQMKQLWNLRRNGVII